jgi:transposase IS66 family protein
LQAAVVTLAVRNRVSRRDSTELARELFGLELATGSVDAIVQRAGEALAAPYTRLEQEIKRARVVNIDETGWKTAGGSRTLWAALTGTCAGLSDRVRTQWLRGEDATRRALRRDRLLRPLGRLRLPRPEPAAALLGAPAPRLHRPQRGHGRTEDLRRRWPPDRPRPGSPPGTTIRTTATGTGCGRRRRRCKPGSANCSNTPPGKARERGTTVSSPRTCSSAGPHSGPSPTPTASSRATTTPSAASAAPSSIASSHSAANPNEANGPSNGSSRLPSPAACNNARSSPTSATLSPPAFAATPSPHSPDHCAT